MSITDDIGWFVVRTKSRSEHRAMAELSNQGFDCYLPELRRERLIRGTEVVTAEPLFSRYLFIRLNRKHSCWHSVRFTRGVTSIVAFGSSAPLVVGDDVIDRIREQCDGCEVQPRFRPGDEVRIDIARNRQIDASTLWGHFHSLDGDGRALVFLSLLGRQHEICVSSDRLELI